MRVGSALGLAVMWRRGIDWLLNDEFGDNRAAGSVNGTLATDGRNVRTVVDTYASTELIANGGFETAGAGGADVFGSWSEIIGSGGAIADETTLVHGGGHAAKLTGGGALDTQLVAQFAVIPGLSYILSFWEQNGTGSGAYSIYDQSHGTNIRSYTSVSNATYAQTQDTFTVPAGCTSVQVYLYCPSGNMQTCYYDDVSVLSAQGLLSQSGGFAVFSGGKAVPAWGDPSLQYSSIARVAGRMLAASLTSPATNGHEIEIGWDANGLGEASDASLGFRPGLALYAIAISPIHVGDVVASTAYKLALLLRANGSFALIKGGAYPGWTLLYVHSTPGTAAIYPMISNYQSVSSVDFVRIPQQLWLPSPLASDGFGSAFGTTDSAGHAEGITGGLGSGGAGKAWTAQLGTWGVSGGKAQATALSGGSAAATIDAGTPNVLIGCDVFRSAVNAGLVCRYVDASNYIRAIHDGTNAALVKIVGGVATTIINAAATYVDGARLQLIADGTSFQLFYNGAKIGSTSTISDAVLQTSNLHGIRTADTANTLDNFVVWARGTEGQYSSLDQWTR
ncbi:MAG: hypothetical protein M1546_19810 [Chloroflexi bacterium]|nr:hypothetical protein [Chloroflexota bacterium]